MARTDGREPTDKDQLYWLREIERANKYFKTFWDKSDKLLKLYARQGDSENAEQQYAMLWANTEVLKPAVYARQPVPQVSRRYKDRDPAGRLASEILERGANYEFERMDINYVLRQCRDDLLLPGRGIAWARYEFDEPTPGEIGEQRVVVEHINIHQFRHSPARTWAEVKRSGWVSKEVYLTEEEGKARFKEAWQNVELDHTAEKSAIDAQDNPSQEKRATIYEIWDAKTKQVIFIAKGGMAPLQIGPPPLRLKNFFPCPPPVFSTLTNESTIPTPDYKYYQDQAAEIDLLTARIHKLTDSLKLVGFFPLGAEGDVPEAIKQALKPGVENQVIGIKSWAAFGERGGTAQIAWLPIKDVVETIRACIELRNQLVQDVYQISGISDIQRGATDPNETLGAQQIKAQWGSIRIRDRQNEMARFSRDLTEITCEIMAENFEFAYLLQMANMQPPQQPPAPPPPPPPDPMADPSQPPPPDPAQMQFQQAMAEFQQQQALYAEAERILKSDRLRSFRIDIETDSTIQPDEDAEKQRRTEFVTAMGSVIQQAAPMIMQAPELMPMIKETLLFTARGFRAGRQLEDVIEQSLDALQQRIAGQQGQQQPDPNAQKLEADKAAAEQKLSFDKASNDQQFMHQQRMDDLAYTTKVNSAKADDEIREFTAQTSLKSSKAKLREEIISEEQEAFMGNQGEAPNAIAQVLTQGLQGMLAVMQQSNQAVLQSNQAVIAALSAPTVVTAPDGRQYTATKQTVN